MVERNKKVKLKKEIGLLGVYAIATGATLSAGFFLLPGLAAVEAGPAIVLAYIVAAIPLIPATFSIIELATAMPRAGGVYYFLDRSLGPWMGTMGGIGTWLALVLKVSFALVGMGAYIALYVPELPIVPVAVGIAIALGALNLLGADKTGGFQVALVVGLLVILTFFVVGGVPQIQMSRLTAMFDVEAETILSTAGLVYISYVGVTKVASLSEEVKDPERNLPLGIILSLITAVLIYGLGTAVMVGVLPLGQLVGDLTPAASA
ncbi:MAG: APC family permease, partial [Candidatus Latescibacterota bacterium]